MCNHPQIAWVGLADGIHCGQCGAKIEPGASAPSGKIPEPVKTGPKPTKAAPKKGGKK
jgi:hypothetical protein